MDAIETARKKVKALIKLAVDSYRRRDMVADLGRHQLEEKSYSSLSNELNGVCVGTADAKLGIGTFINVFGLACIRDGESREYALRAIDELEKLAGRVTSEIPATASAQLDPAVLWQPPGKDEPVDCPSPDVYQLTAMNAPSRP